MKAQVSSYRCGCSVTATPVYDAPRDPAYVFPDSHIKWCPLHAAAEEMRDLLAKLIASAARMQSKSRSFSTIGAAEYLDLYTNAEDARTLLAKVEG